MTLLLFSDAGEGTERSLNWHDNSNKKADDSKIFSNNGLDARRTRGSDTTYGYSFSSSRSSSRMCPYGKEITDGQGVSPSVPKFHVQELTFVVNYIPVGYSPSRRNYNPDYTAIKMFALTFRSQSHELFTTVPIIMDPLNLPKLSNDIMVCLLRLPNSVIDGVQVYSNQSAQPIGEITPSGRAYHSIVNSYVTFTGPSVQGPQHMLSIQCT